MHRKRPEHKVLPAADSELAKTQALQHLMALGLPPQGNTFPDNTSIQNTKAIVIKPQHNKQRQMIIQQMYKTPGMQ
jgi:hypothetical protein